MVEEGYLSLLAGDLGGLEAYWRQLLLDFPGHPAHGHEAESIPLTLYGLLLHDSPMVFSPEHQETPEEIASQIWDCYFPSTPKTPEKFVSQVWDRSTSGDEGNAFRSSWMTFHFQPDLSPLLTNSACSRFLITTVPSSMRPVDNSNATQSLSPYENHSWYSRFQGWFCTPFELPNWSGMPMMRMGSTSLYRQLEQSSVIL